MSLFRTGSIDCPACAKSLPFQTAYSINADRRPDLRAAILDGSLQRMDCPHCGARFRLDADFTVLDIARGQWLFAAPVARIAEWDEVEAQARALFGQAYGSAAPEIAQQLGAKLRPRIVFGWPALREKLLAADLKLDDVALEGVKATLLRHGGPIPALAVAELRLVGAQGDELLFEWLRSYDGAAGDALVVPRALHDEIAADAQGGWAEFRAGFADALFVDLKRQLLPRKEVAAA